MPHQYLVFGEPRAAVVRQCQEQGFSSFAASFNLTCLTWLTWQARLYQALSGLSTDNLHKRRPRRPLRDVQEAASHADPRTTMRYDRARVSLDRRATYIVAAYIAGAVR